MMKAVSAVIGALVVAGVFAQNDTWSSCEPGLWGGLLEQWATTPDHGGRHGRVMSLSPTKGYYVSDRIDGPLVPPPPQYHQPGHHGPSHNSLTHSGQHSGPGYIGPAHNGPMYNGPAPNGPMHSGPSPNGPMHSGPSPNGPTHSGPSHNGPANGPANNGPSHTAPHVQHHAPHQQAQAYSQYDEWQVSPPPPAGGKIVNKPPYKDQFRPSYAPPQNKPIPISQQQWAAADRVDVPQKQVSETDLYLLSAIEKLVYRVDLMEKRLRKMEDTMHYLVVGKETKPEPCKSNFTRIGNNCYLVSTEAGDWKAASLRCRKLRAHLLELDDFNERRAVQAALLSDKGLKGTDFWTGGLNPGLLWIWAHSARPVETNTTANSTASSTTIVGEGRCLGLVHDPALSTYVYRGLDCSLRQRYVCELPEEKTKLSNEIERVARELGTISRRKARISWTDDQPSISDTP